MKTFKMIMTPLLLLLIVFSCNKSVEITDEPEVSPPVTCANKTFDFQNEQGCDGRSYPNPIESNYVLPFDEGKTYKTGLTNCSSSYHGPDHPDRYAFDFDMEVGTHFSAARAGIVKKVVNNQPSGGGGGAGNYCVIDHRDGTYGLYYHSPKNGISVSVGDTVNQGGWLGVTGRSGLAGYPHLHFIVVQSGYDYPYDAIPVSFKNVVPPDVILKSNTEYKACEY